jgi:hypothetical protein
MANAASVERSSSSGYENADNDGRRGDCEKDVCPNGPRGGNSDCLNSGDAVNRYRAGELLEPLAKGKTGGHRDMADFTLQGHDRAITAGPMAKPIFTPTRGCDYDGLALTLSKVFYRDFFRSYASAR